MDGGERVGKGVYRVIIETGVDLEINQQPLTRANPETSLSLSGEDPASSFSLLSFSFMISDPSY